MRHPSRTASRLCSSTRRHFRPFLRAEVRLLLHVSEAAQLQSLTDSSHGEASVHPRSAVSSSKRRLAHPRPRGQPTACDRVLGAVVVAPPRTPRRPPYTPLTSPANPAPTRCAALALRLLVSSWRSCGSRCRTPQTLPSTAATAWSSSPPSSLEQSFKYCSFFQS